MHGTNDPCRVPGTQTEYFDCCNRETINSMETESICTYIGTFHVLTLAAVFIAQIALLCTKKLKPLKKWLYKGQQKILVIVMFFHILTIVWRVMLFLKYGHPNQGVTATSYMLYKSSAVGDLGSSLTALCVFMRYIKTRYRTLKANENLPPSQIRKNFQEKLKSASYFDRYSIYAKAWISVIFIYFPIWTSLIVKSLNFDFNLEFQDKGMTIVLIVFTILISVLSCQAYSQVK